MGNLQKERGVTPASSELPRVLLVHNHYQQQGGEDSVVAAELELLKSCGHEVDFYSRHNDEISGMSRIAVAGETLWSSNTKREFGRVITDFQPDVIHVHNTFPLISPSLYWAATKARVPVVQTLHNFRLLCPQGTLLRDGKVCEDCVGHLPWRGVVHGCYRESVAQSGVLATMLSVHRLAGTYRQRIGRYIALSEFCRSKFIEAGWDGRRLSVKPNFVDIAKNTNQARGSGLYVGRLSVEKGISVLAEAASRISTISLNVIGTGPLSEQIACHSNISALGWQEPATVELHMRAAAFLMLPSICYESFPRTVVEAFACGTPVIASRLGSLAEIVADGVTGLLFNPGSAEDLAEKIAWAESHPDRMRQMGSRARMEYEAKYTAERNYGQLMNIYRAAMADMPDQ